MTWFWAYCIAERLSITDRVVGGGSDYGVVSIKLSKENSYHFGDKSMQEQPLVSIITATYNRSNVLCYTISSVINSRFTNWEMIIVGDACTDDTEAVVSSFGDPRIRFINLGINTGHQAGPNNAGFALAKGRYIAYINHDDLWFPDHLDKCLQTIQEKDADWVFSMGILVRDENDLSLQGVSPEERFHPKYGIMVEATQWLLKRELLEELNGWTSYKTIHLPPSQDLILRAWKKGKKIYRVPAVTTFLIPSGTRKNVYLDRCFEENQEYFLQMSTNIHFREQQIFRTLLSRETLLVYNSLNLKRAFRNLIVVLLIYLLFRSILAVCCIYKTRADKNENQQNKFFHI